MPPIATSREPRTYHVGRSQDTSDDFRPRSTAPRRTLAREAHRPTNRRTRFPRRKTRSPRRRMRSPRGKTRSPRRRTRSPRRKARSYDITVHSPARKVDPPRIMMRLPARRVRSDARTTRSPARRAHLDGIRAHFSARRVHPDARKVHDTACSICLGKLWIGSCRDCCALRSPSPPSLRWARGRPMVPLFASRSPGPALEPRPRRSCPLPDVHVIPFRTERSAFDCPMRMTTRPRQRPQLAPITTSSVDGSSTTRSRAAPIGQPIMTRIGTQSLATGAVS
jgi:hypothetical protein